MKCSICKEEGHTKRFCQKMTTSVSQSTMDVETSETDVNIDNEILEKIQLLRLRSMAEHIASMRVKFPKLTEWSDAEINELYNCNNSYSQSERCKNGGNFEKCIEQVLYGKNIRFAKQIPINKDGIIVSETKNNKIVDIIIGSPTIGMHISNYIVLSLKTSTRERYSEDDWTKVHVPKLYLYGTLTTDYPSPEKFEESATRKMLCINPKKNDTRIFKLRFNDLHDLLRE
jgi:hypothetical protein